VSEIGLEVPDIGLQVPVVGLQVPEIGLEVLRMKMRMSVVVKVPEIGLQVSQVIMRMFVGKVSEIGLQVFVVGKVSEIGLQVLRAKMRMFVVVKVSQVKMGLRAQAKTEMYLRLVDISYFSFFLSDTSGSSYIYIRIFLF
jgi:hypothetical protein